jgi:hypothetical protein
MVDKEKSRARLSNNGKFVGVILWDLFALFGDGYWTIDGYLTNLFDEG